MLKAHATQIAKKTVLVLSKRNGVMGPNLHFINVFFESLFYLQRFLWIFKKFTFVNITSKFE